MIVLFFILVTADWGWSEWKKVCEMHATQASWMPSLLTHRLNCLNNLCWLVPYQNSSTKRNPPPVPFAPSIPLRKVRTITFIFEFLLDMSTYVELVGRSSRLSYPRQIVSSGEQTCQENFTQGSRSSHLWEIKCEQFLPTLSPFPSKRNKEITKMNPLSNLLLLLQNIFAFGVDWHWNLEVRCRHVLNYLFFSLSLLLLLLLLLAGLMLLFIAVVPALDVFFSSSNRNKSPLDALHLFG